MATGLDSKSMEYIARNLLAGGRLNQLDCIFLIIIRKMIFAFIDLEDSPAKLSKMLLVSVSVQRYFQNTFRPTRWHRKKIHVAVIIESSSCSAVGSPKHFNIGLLSSIKDNAGPSIEAHRNHHETVFCVNFRKSHVLMTERKKIFGNMAEIHEKPVQ